MARVRGWMGNSNGMRAVTHFLHSLHGSSFSVRLNKTGMFGVGGGWNKPEMENHGCAYATRFQRLEEQLQALKAIWTQDEAEFHGDHVNFDPMWCWPKPVTARPCYATLNLRLRLRRGHHHISHEFT